MTSQLWTWKWTIQGACECSISYISLSNKKKPTRKLDILYMLYSPDGSF